ncbi:hypothetical protein ACFY4B_27120 [Kitasatospora sp. NPDC001261]|uniref:hypothetical protein n=1 Tax=Kitasatospora sp. NPDC001261 TaxID=3364012 RepID=UPI0036B4C1F5
MSRSTEIRSFVYRLSKIHGCPMETDYYDHRKKWEIRWHDGPTSSLVLAAVARQLPDHREIIYASRDFSEEAIVLSAIRLFASGEASQWRDLRYAAIRALEDIGFPLRTATDRESAMVERALEESARDTRWGRDRDADYALKLLTDRRGIGWLLAPPAAGDRHPEADTPLAAVPRLTPIELLTSHYAHGDHAAAWRERAAPMPAAEAFAAALADPEPGQDCALAALALVEHLRATLDSQEVAIIDRARAAGASWTDVGQVLRIARQSAHKHYKTLAARPAPPSANS